MAPAAERFLVWGGGGHGKVVADLVRALGHTVAGYVDGDAAKLGMVVEPGGGVVLSTADELLAIVRETGGYPAGITAVALAIGDNAARLRCLEQLGGLAAPVLVHPSAVVSPSARFGKGTVVFAGCVVNADALVGRGVIVNTRAVVEHDCVLGDGVHLSPGALLSGGASVGTRGWVGAGATVIQQVAVGSDTVVGAGAVVIRNVPDGAKVVGNPAKPLIS